MSDKQVESSDCLRDRRNPHTNLPLRTSSQTCTTTGLSWAPDKDSLQEGTQELPVSDRVCGRYSSAEKGAQEIEQLEEDGQLSESDATPHRLCHERGETHECRKFQHRRALTAGSGLHGDPVHNRKTSSIAGHQKSSLASEKTPPHESFISQVLLRLQIKLSDQRDCLGISIAGGKGSLPYKDRDEGIFISRVTKGGPSEKAGIHVGDRLLEVDGLNVQGATHHEAVSALRNAGSIIKMTVLRERLLTGEPFEQDEPCDPLDDVTGRQPCRVQRSEQPKIECGGDCLMKRIEAAVCNGNGISDMKSDLNFTLSEQEEDASIKNDSLQIGKHTMTIPRIILTHPSTSDEDVELLTQSLGREPLHDFYISDRHPDCFDSAFYPP
ncbi:protein scribble homolog [Solea solea]|uniref:protein scribble homolog n=1 Tax=Solea solea TaxID=90069 RepID=UPI00272D817B|nr:protein scribble homolog [Solea solea]